MAVNDLRPHNGFVRAGFFFVRFRRLALGSVTDPECTEFDRQSRLPLARPSA